MIVRTASGDDWPAIWPFFRAIVAAGETYTYPRDIGEADARALWMLAPPGDVMVAIGDEGRVIGSAKVTANRMGPGSHVANASFMVDPAAARQGAGRALGEAALAWATAQGFRAMQFNAVVSSNAAAVALWQSLGFRIVGTVPGAFAHPTLGYVDLHVMHRTLG